MLPALSPFPTMFSKGLFTKGIKSQHFMEWVSDEPLMITWHCGEVVNVIVP